MPADRAAEASMELIRTSLDADGVLTAVIDMPGRTMNVFSPELMDGLEALIERVEADPSVRAVVLTSGKPSFLAGADLAMVRMFTERAETATPAEMTALCGRLGRLFRRLELAPKPVVAALNGLALGGGLELALVCRHRLVADDARIQLGLPEVKLGLLPGAGGTQRLPRLIGVEKGLAMLLSGAPIPPQEALACGLVDAVAPADELMRRAKALALEAATGPTRAHRGDQTTGPFDFAATDAVPAIAAHYGLSPEVVARYPAYRAIIRCVAEGWTMPLDAALDNEMELFLGLMFDPVAGNMIRTLFLDRQRADKLAQDARASDPAGVVLVGRGEAVDTLSAALTRAKLPVRTPAERQPGDLVIACVGSAEAKPDLALLAGPDETPEAAGAPAGIHFAASKAYGRVMEIVAREDGARQTALALARRLVATPFVHAGPHALLLRLAAARREALTAGADEDGVLLACAEAAAALARDDRTMDCDLADVAAVITGEFPAYAGGPFAFLRQRGRRSIGAAA